MQDLERPENRFRLFPFLLSSLSLPFLHWLTTLSVIAIESILHPSIPPSLHPIDNAYITQGFPPARLPYKKGVKRKICRSSPHGEIWFNVSNPKRHEIPLSIWLARASDPERAWGDSSLARQFGAERLIILLLHTSHAARQTDSSSPIIHSSQLFLLCYLIFVPPLRRHFPFSSLLFPSSFPYTVFCA